MISLEDALNAFVRVSCDSCEGRQPAKRGSNEQKRALRCRDLKLEATAGAPQKGLVDKVSICNVEAATLTFTNVAKHARKLVDKVLLLYLLILV